MPVHVISTEWHVWTAFSWKTAVMQITFYARLREKVKVVMLECRESFADCFCVSMGTNKAEQYDAAVRITENEVLVDVKDAALISDFSSASACDFTPEYVHENQEKTAQFRRSQTAVC